MWKSRLVSTSKEHSLSWCKYSKKRRCRRPRSNSLRRRRWPLRIAYIESVKWKTSLRNTLELSDFIINNQLNQNGYQLKIIGGRTLTRKERPAPQHDEKPHQRLDEHSTSGRLPALLSTYGNSVCASPLQALQGGRAATKGFEPERKEAALLLCRQ